MESVKEDRCKTDKQEQKRYMRKKFENRKKIQFKIIMKDVEIKKKTGKKCKIKE